MANEATREVAWEVSIDRDGCVCIQIKCKCSRRCLIETGVSVDYDLDSDSKPLVTRGCRGCGQKYRVRMVVEPVKDGDDAGA